MTKVKVLADGSRICRPQAYANREELPKSDPAVSAVILGLHHCMAEPETSEYSESFPDATGVYENEGAVLCLNQAGLHVEVWFSRVPTFKGANRPIERYAGELDEETGRFELVREEGPGKAILRVAEKSSDSVTISFDDGEELELLQVSSRARWSDRVLKIWRRARLDGAHAIMKGVLDREHAPLTTWQVRSLEDLLLGDRITSLLAALFREDPEARNEAAMRRRLNALYREFRNQGFPRPRDEATHRIAFAEVDKDRVRAHAREILLGSKLTLMGPGGAQSEYTRYEWFQRVLHYNENYTPAGGVWLPLKTWFAVEPPGKCRYKLTFKGWGYGLSASIPFADRLKKKMKKVTESMPDMPGKGYLQDKVFSKIEAVIGASAGGKRLTGTLTIECLQPPGWTQDYIVDYAYASAGHGGAGFSWNEKVEATGWCETPVEWLPQDFHGDLTHFSGEMARWDGKKKKNQFIWNFAGSGADRGTQLIFDEVKSEFDVEMLGLGWGSVFGAEDQIAPPEDNKRFKKIEHQIELEESTDVHFVLGSATVTEQGRKKLRAFAANELAELRDADSVLQISGFADRIDRRWYNKILSEMRAANTLTALKDCTGDGLKAEVELFGAGEDALALLNQHMDFPDDQAAPDWRRVFVTLNGLVTIVLKVRDLNPPKPD